MNKFHVMRGITVVVVISQTECSVCNTAKLCIHNESLLLAIKVGPTQMNRESIEPYMGIKLF